MRRIQSRNGKAFYFVSNARKPASTDASYFAGRNPKTLLGKKRPKTVNLSTTTLLPPGSSSNSSPSATWTPMWLSNKASKLCNKSSPPFYKNSQAMTRDLAKRMEMALEDRVRTACHRVGSTESIKDTRHHTLVEERRAHGVEGLRLMVQHPMARTDGTNRKARR